MNYCLMKIFEKEIRMNRLLEKLKDGLVTNKDFDYYDAFTFIDNTKEGNIDPDNMQTFIKKHKSNVTEDEVLAIFRRVNTDTDAKIKFKEFFKFFRPIDDSDGKFKLADQAYPVNSKNFGDPVKKRSMARVSRNSLYNSTEKLTNHLSQAQNSMSKSTAILATPNRIYGSKPHTQMNTRENSRKKLNKTTNLFSTANYQYSKSKSPNQRKFLCDLNTSADISEVSNGITYAHKENLKPKNMNPSNHHNYKMNQRRDRIPHHSHRQKNSENQDDNFAEESPMRNPKIVGQSKACSKKANRNKRSYRPLVEEKKLKQKKWMPLVLDSNRNLQERSTPVANIHDKENNNLHKKKVHKNLTNISNQNPNADKDKPKKNTDESMSSSSGVNVVQANQSKKPSPKDHKKSGEANIQNPNGEATQVTSFMYKTNSCEQNMNYTTTSDSKDSKPNLLSVSPTFDNNAGEQPKLNKSDELLVDKMLADLLKRIIVFSDKIEEMQKELFINHNINLYKIFTLFDKTNKGYLLIEELKELFNIIMDKQWDSDKNLYYFLTILTRRDPTTDEVYHFHLGDFLKIFSPSHPITQTQMHSNFFSLNF